jgi:dihydropteroate synthase
MSGEPFVWRAGAHTFDCRRRTFVMGVLNVTPDSFSDGGRFVQPGDAVAEGVRMAAEGADMLDVGGESTRPGSEAVPPEEERRRVLPVIEGLRREAPGIALSVDTRKAEVAAVALAAGASIVNDVTAGSDPAMFGVVRDGSAGMVLMHMRGDPATMQQLTDYGDVVAEVKAHLRDRVDAAVAAGIEWDRLCVDPGLGFAKTAEQSLLLMKEVATLLDLRRPVLVGPSRKSFIGTVLGAEVDDRLEGTAGAVAWMVGLGAHVVRVHDVKAMVQVVRVLDAIRWAGEPRPEAGDAPA